MQKKPSKKSLQAEVQRLRQSPGWDPSKHVRPDAMEQLRGLEQEQKNQKTYEKADVCEDCIKAREEAKDPSALCDLHLQQALGF